MSFGLIVLIVPVFKNKVFPHDHDPLGLISEFWKRKRSHVANPPSISGSKKVCESSSPWLAA